MRSTLFIPSKIEARVTEFSVPDINLQQGMARRLFQNYYCLLLGIQLVYIYSLEIRFNSI